MNLFGMPVYESPLIRSVPKIQLSPGFKYCTPEFRAEMNQWLLEQFGTKHVAYAFDGRLALSPEQMRLLKMALTDKSPARDE